MFNKDNTDLAISNRTCNELVVILKFVFNHTLQLSRVCNCYLFLRFPTVRAKAFNGLDDIHSRGDRAEYNMLTIQPSSFCSADEKLGSICVSSGTGHGQDSRSSVLQLEVFIFKFVAIDGLSASSITSGEITSLAHEAWNDPVE